MKEKQIDKKKILVVDDSSLNREILTDILAEEFEILEAGNGARAVDILREMGDMISLVLLDIVMPTMDGFEVLAVMNKYHWIEDIPVIMISSENSSSCVEYAYHLGVIDYLSRPFNALVVRNRVRNNIRLHEKQKRLVGLVTDQIYESQKSNNMMVEVLSHIVEFRNGESGLHVFHIQTMTELLLKRLMQKTDQYHLTYSSVSIISIASALHDIGKIAIPEEILNKPGRLTKEEFEVMKTHSQVGAVMLEELPVHQNEGLVKAAREICRWHHERYDGKGYPDGLKGEEIPISAQIVSLADVYDALTSKRVYKEAYSHETALQMIFNGECGAFNPLLLECLKDISVFLQDELRVNSVGHRSWDELRSITEETLHNAELGSSAQASRFLEHQRLKCQFLSSISSEIQFEFTNMPPMVILSEWGAKQLGIEAVIMNPMESGKVADMIRRENLEELLQMIKGTTPEQPRFTYECELNIKGEKKRYQLTCCTTWSSDEIPRYLGILGRVKPCGIMVSER